MTLTQKEQTRLQALNSLLAEHMTTEQEATLMGLSTRHARRILAAYRKGQPSWLMAIEVADPPMLCRTHWRKMWCYWHALGTQESTIPTLAGC